MTSTDDREDRVAGGLLGLLVGDALGVPYEFRQASDLPPEDALEYDPPPGFPRAHAAVPPGTWSDDGAQALCLLESLLEVGALDLHDFARRLLAWYEEGHLAADGVVFDCGLQTSRAFGALAEGVPPRDAGPAGERDNGNGALMRVLPLALWHRGDDAELVWLAGEQSRVTHGHLRSRLCCGLYCLWARYELERRPNAWVAAWRRVSELLGDDPRAAAELAGPLRAHAERPGGSGYVVDCLHSAHHATRAADFAGVVRRAIALGDDTDTTAAVAGGIAGLRHGRHGIPARWLERLRGRAQAEALLARLLERVAG